jgi:hypothetical protein
MESMDANAAPLDQNVKNLECEGMPYRVIKEDARPLRYVSLVSLIYYLVIGNFAFP